MKTGRLEAFSDGVLAIIITIMVLEMKAPKETTLEGLWSIFSIFTSYVLSFIYLGIYWNNHQSFNAGHRKSQRTYSLGQSLSTFLVVPDSLCHKLGGRKL